MYAQLLIAVSFALASYQDIKERAVNDLVWIPALAAAVYVAYWYAVNETSSEIEFFLIKLALVGGVALAFTFLGGIGQADAIALAFIAADPYPLSPLAPLLAGSAVALVHIAYEYATGKGKGRTVPMEQFLREQRWIPKAIIADGSRTTVSSDVNVAREEVVAANKPGAEVEVKYGVPTVAYLGLGYVAYLVYLVVLNGQAFVSIP